ncbi:MAG: response regulator [Elusimicrobia bacterium]|nr:response regulator [Elusimicrobiota bacterium]
MAKILIIDDEADMRLAMRQLLEELGHSVLEAGDGSSALGALDQNPADLVLLDLRLPGMDGVEILEKIRKRSADLPVFIITGYGHEEALRQVMSLGATDCFTKPFHNRDLAAAIERTLSERQLKTSQSLYERRLAEKLSPPPERPTTAPLPQGTGKKSFQKNLILAALAGFMLAVLTIAAHRFINRDPMKSYPLASKHPSAMVWSNDRLWVADWLDEEIHRYRLEGKTLVLEKTYPVKGIHLSGLAIAGEFAFTADSWKKVIYQHRIEPSFEIMDIFPSPGPSPSCLYFDGERLISADSQEQKIYWHHQPPKTIEAAFHSPAAAPVAIGKDGNKLFLLDAETSTIIKTQISQRLDTLATFKFPLLDQRSPVGAGAFANTSLWIGWEGLDTVLRIPKNQWNAPTAWAHSQ